jgi:glycosyltransferase involved in cell wall biosynthesis
VRHRAEQQKKLVISFPQPAVSIIIPMRNEEKYIGKCLESILANNFDRDQYEILVADGESSDRSREAVLRQAERFPNIRLLHNPKKIVPSGLNEAIRQARGRYIIRMDAHCEYPPDYIKNCVAELERTGAANVGGRCITCPGADTTVAKTIALLTQTRAGVGNSAYRVGEGDRYVDTVPFGAFRREVFDNVGPYREDLARNQDYELNARIRGHGHKIFLSSKIYVTYYNVPTFARFMRQAFMNGSWNARCWRRYPASFCWRHVVPLVFVSGLIGLSISGLVFWPALWLLVFGLSVYTLLALSASAQIARQGEWKCAILAPALMFSYHFMYGSATIVGLLHPPNPPPGTYPTQVQDKAVLP